MTMNDLERPKRTLVQKRCVFGAHCNKKLSYRRETARQLHTSFSAHSLIAHFTEHCICLQLHNRLAKLVSTLSANKTCDIRTLSWIGHSRSFKVILIGAGRNPERCVVVMRH